MPKVRPPAFIREAGECGNVSADFTVIGSITTDIKNYGLTANRVCNIGQESDNPGTRGRVGPEGRVAGVVVVLLNPKGECHDVVARGRVHERGVGDQH